MRWKTASKGGDVRQNLLAAVLLAPMAVLGGTTTAAQAAVGTTTPARAAVPGGTTIAHPSFTGGTGLVLNGSAVVTGGVLRLTSGRRDQAGAAWSATTIDPRRAFDTAFDVTTGGPAPHADGFAFVVQGDGSRAIGGLGGSIGYGGMTRSVAVEFDTYRNRGEADGNHVAVVSGGGPQGDAAPAPMPLFGARLHVRVGYQAGTVTVSVRRADETWTHVLTRKVDLAAVVGTGAVRVGFTAATGRSASTQDILSWRFTQP
jgi:hypothetical protein